MTPLLPLHTGHGGPGGPAGPDGLTQGALSIAPIMGTLLLLLLLAGLAAAYLWRQGKITLPTLPRRRSPEDDAKGILAERFARGDLSSEEFMERASILNWTPGSDSLPSRPRGRR